MSPNGQIRYIWDNRVRTQLGRARHGAAISDHLDTTAEPYFAAVRELLESWITRYPTHHRAGMAGRLRSRDDAQVDSAFWELYLHEAYIRASCSIEVEPSVPGTRRRPDFLIQGPGEPFYLEATSIRKAASEVAADNRLAAIHEMLRSQAPNAPFRVAVNHYQIGNASPSASSVTAFLRQWFATLSYDSVLAAYSEKGVLGLPMTTWHEGGWHLEFIAFPDSPSPDSGVMVMWGPGQASLLDYHKAILAAVQKKAKAYGNLDAPLVLALQINTEYHSDDHQSELALYGLHLPHPPDGIPASATLQDSGDGFWVERGGYRRRHVPQVIAASNLHIGSLTTQPRLWPHPDPRVHLLQHPSLFAVVQLGPALVQTATPPDVYFDLDPELRRSS